MKALPETFDMVKRLGLFLWFSKQLIGPMTFDEVFSKYQASHDILSKDLAQLRPKWEGKTNIWALKKTEIGLPNMNSQTSLSKYARVGHGIGLFFLESVQRRWALKPSWMTFILKTYSEGQANIFDLTDREKLLLFCQLLETDDVFIVPLIDTINTLPLNIDRWVKDKEFDLGFVENIISYIEDGFKLGLIENHKATYLKRFRFFEHNRDLLRNGKEPTGGFLHMIEPRVHWLIDLSFVDRSEYFRNGVVAPGVSWEKFRSKIDSTEDYKQRKLKIISNYICLLKQEPKRGSINEEDETRNAIDFSVAALKNAYPTMIPLEAIIRSSFVMSSLSLGNSVDEERIIDIIKRNYNIYRDWRSGPGFLEVKNQSSS